MRKELLSLFLIFMCVATAWSCTSAIVSGSVTKNGRPLLWKNRDTGEENNKVARVKSINGNFEYVALYNSSDKNCREAWIGHNSQGFAIMNTASYNLKADKVKSRDMDKEGFIMSEALARCVTVDDFERLLKLHKKPLGVEANFGVIDAYGNGAYFETNNYTYKKYDLKDAKSGVIVRTNYSHSGRDGEGFGYIRENNAEQLLAQHITNKDITPATFTEELSRSFYHSLIGKDFSEDDRTWIVDQDFIPRRISTASVVIEGIKLHESPLLTTMWTGIGYPPCSEIKPVWVGENGVPKELQADAKSGRSPECDRVLKLKYDVFSIKRGSGKSYLNVKKLYNSRGDGYCQKLETVNAENYRRGYEAIGNRRNELNNK
ncbi:MAG: hypothetical protein RR706_05025 [Muribaculaceae bacterium]